MIYNWQTQNIPSGKIYDKNGELIERPVIQVDTETGECIAFVDDIASCFERLVVPAPCTVVFDTDNQEAVKDLGYDTTTQKNKAWRTRRKKHPLTGEKK